MKNFFSIFRESNNTFEGKERDEVVLLLIRRHPFYIIVKIVISIIFAVLPILAGTVFTPFIISHGLVGLFLFVCSLWCLILWLALSYFITMYALDVWIVTDRRIIDSTQHGFFNRSTAELHLVRIQDISVETVGVIQTFFKFGNLEVQTSGTQNKFQFLQIPDPNSVKNTIMSAIGSAPSLSSGTV